MDTRHYWDAYVPIMLMPSTVEYDPDDEPFGPGKFITVRGPVMPTFIGPFFENWRVIFRGGGE